MSKRLRPFLLSGLLLAMVSWLAALLTGEWIYLRNERIHSGKPGAQQAAPAAEPELLPDDFALPDVSQYPQLVERPLFMESRRPSQPAPPKPPEPPTPPKPEAPPAINFKVMGILETPEGKMALIADAKGKYKRLKVNDSMDGWQIADIKPDRVLIEQNGFNEDLSLLKRRAAGPMPPAASGPAPTPQPPGRQGRQPGQPQGNYPRQSPQQRQPLPPQAAPPQPVPQPPMQPEGEMSEGMEPDVMDNSGMDDSGMVPEDEPMQPDQ
jgi:hypothetical protein